MEGQQQDEVGSAYGGGHDQLAMLEGLAEHHDADVSAAFAPHQEGVAEGPEEAGYSTVMEAKCLLKSGRALAGQFYGCIRKIYTDETIDEVAEALAPVMKKYGWTEGGLFEKWGPEINLAMVVLPLGMVTVQAIRAENEMRRAMAEAARNGQGVAHGTQGDAAAVQ